MTHFLTTNPEESKAGYESFCVCPSLPSGCYFLSDRGEGLKHESDRRSAFSSFILLSLKRRGLDRGELNVTTGRGRAGKGRRANIRRQGQQVPKTSPQWCLSNSLSKKQRGSVQSLWLWRYNQNQRKEEAADSVLTFDLWLYFSNCRKTENTQKTKTYYMKGVCVCVGSTGHANNDNACMEMLSALFTHANGS